ncbi:MAG: NAD(P)-dependent oxidoreductase [Alkalispirochaeta sp.]
MSHVLIADSFPDSSRKEIEQLGTTVHYEAGATADTLPELAVATEATILVVRSTKVGAEVFERAPALQLVIRAGAGVNTIDLEAASAHAVRVANCPGTNAAAVAELTMGLLLALDRRIPDNVIDLRRGRWNKKEYSAARGLAGRALGVIGTGSIGREVISRARAFGMDVVAWSRSLTPKRAEALGVRRAHDVYEVARSSDAVTVHVAATAETKQLLDERFFAELPEGALVVNTSRATVVDERAMRQAVRERGLRVGLDVFDGEPSGGEGEVDPALFAAEFADASAGLMYGTHHIGASTEQAQTAVAAATVERIRAFLAGEAVPSLVNVPERDTPAPADAAVLEIRHRNRVGVLAHALTALEQAGINVRGMTNHLFSGDEGALATIQVEPIPSPAAIATVSASHSDILAVRISSAAADG